MKVKKALALIMAVTMAASLAACGSDTATESTPAAAEPESTVAEGIRYCENSFERTAFRKVSGQFQSQRGHLGNVFRYGKEVLRMRGTPDGENAFLVGSAAGKIAEHIHDAVFGVGSETEEKTIRIPAEDGGGGGAVGLFDEKTDIVESGKRQAADSGLIVQNLSGKNRHGEAAKTGITVHVR